jgi:predicted enzyme related to lactoylglutathione lyase
MDGPTKPRVAYVNLLAHDIAALARFYAELFGFPEIVAHRSPIYRCLDGGAVELGFNADQAYDLLGIGDRRPAGAAPVRAYLTIEVGSPEAVAAAAAAAAAQGGRVIKPPYQTYYNACQAVLEDPEGNVFRVNHRIGPRQPADQLAHPPWANPVPDDGDA